jgi:GTP-binding protein LepA
MLNDSALQYEPIYSKALGSGLRVGFLGLLHADVVHQRLEQEFNMSVVLTAPTVEYVPLTHSTDKMKYQEPIVEVTVVTPQTYTGIVMKLCEESRGTFVTMDNKSQTILVYELPLSELITYFFDRLKTVTSGYATLQWEFKEYRNVDVEKLELMLNLEVIEEFSEYVVHERAYQRARELTDKLKELIPRQNFEVKIQARYKGKILASSRIAPFRKDVTAKLYGGDRTRKDKLLKKQKEGKKKMKQIGSVEVPKDVFLKLFKRE